MPPLLNNSIQSTEHVFWIWRRHMTSGDLVGSTASRCYDPVCIETEHWFSIYVSSLNIDIFVATLATQ